jgi:sulfoxide reductase heme-binding subunit YedZ
VSSTVWYLARSAGLVGYLLLSTSVVLGVVMSARATLTLPRFAVEELHRFLAIVTGVFIGIHGLTLVLDRVVPLSLGQAIVPFTSSYRPFAVGLGVLTAELLAAVGISNALRKHIEYRLWRQIHYVTILVWAGATVHGLLAGTDRQDLWFLALMGLAVCSVALAFLARFVPRADLTAVALTSAAAAVTVLALAFAPA